MMYNFTDLEQYLMYHPSFANLTIGNLTNHSIWFYTPMYDDGTEKDTAFFIFEIARFIISFLIISLNSLLLCCYCWKKRQIKKTASKQFLVSLAVCDLVIGTSVGFQAVCYYWKQMQYLEVRITLDVYQLFLKKVYVLHLCSLTLERYISLFYALRYKAVVTKRTVTWCIVGTWGIPFILSSIRLSWLLNIPTADQAENDDEVEVWYSMILFIIFFAIPMFLLAIAYLQMFHEIRRIMRSPPGHNGVIKCLSKEVRVVIIFSLMYFVFLIVAMPYFSLRFWIDICSWRGYLFRIKFNTIRVIVILKSISSILNPIFYAFITPEIRKAIKKQWVKARGGEASHKTLLEPIGESSKKLSAEKMEKLGTKEENVEIKQ